MWMLPVESGHFKVVDFLVARFRTNPSMWAFTAIRNKLKPITNPPHWIPPPQLTNPKITGFFTTMTMFELEIRYVH